MEIVVSSHIIAAALQVIGVPDIASAFNTVPHHQLHSSLDSVLEAIVTQYINFSFPSTGSSSRADHVLEYAKETLSLGLLLLEFKDAIREGDGSRVLRCWKYFLPLFKATGHKNYSFEALYLLSQYYYTLPPQLAEKMLWGRFINTHGRIGKNISCDLHMEHLNRMCKIAVNHLGANKTPSSIIRIGKALGPLADILKQYDSTVGIHESGSHTRRSDCKDVHMIVEQLIKCHVFAQRFGRYHKCFKKFGSNKILSSIDREKLDVWMKEKLSFIISESSHNR